MSRAEPCNCSSSSLRLLLLLAALFFTILAGLFLAAAAALPLVAGRATLSAAALLVPVLVLLVIVLLLLLFLLWCCCRGRREPDLGRLRALAGLLPGLLPALREASTGLGAAIAALNTVGGALTAAHEKIGLAAGAFRQAGLDLDVVVPNPQPQTGPFGLGNVAVVTDLVEPDTPLMPFGSAKTQLETASGFLTGDESVAGKLNAAGLQCNQVALGLQKLKDLLDTFLPSP